MSAQAISLPRLILAVLIRALLIIAMYIATGAVALIIGKGFPADCGVLTLGPNGPEIEYRTLTSAQIVLGTVPGLVAAVMTYAACRWPLMSWRTTQVVSVVWAIIIGGLILQLTFKYPHYIC